MRPATPEQIIELTDKLEAGIKDIYASGRYAEYLGMMAKLHHYSIRNSILIFFQCPSATMVAGYRAWKKDFGRQVKKGEKGICIFAPCPTKRYVEEPVIDAHTGKPVRDPDGTVKKAGRWEIVTLYKVAHVFDVSQTEGKELPSLGVDELTGDVDHFSILYERLTSISPVPVEVEDFPEAAKGYYSSEEGRIVVKAGMSQVQTVKTLIHEIAHAKLHDPANVPKEERKGRAQREVEAESVAYVVCQKLGIDTSDYSFGYLAGWSKGKELEEMRESLDTIRSAAADIIDAIQPQERDEIKKSRNKQPVR